jgi:filamin
MARPEWKLIQENTFRRWCTQSLKSRGIDINDLATDFSDGVQLVALLEVLSQKKLGRYNKNPKLRAQKLENCGLCLDFIKSEGLHVVNIGKYSD